MKKLPLAILAVGTLFLFADEIDTMVKQIESKRKTTIPKEKLLSIESPMPRVIKVENNSTKENNTTVIAKPQNDTFYLTAIMNNKAFINGKWVGRGEFVGSYKLIDIMDDSVFLKDGNKTKLIFFKDNLKKIKIKIGR